MKFNKEDVQKYLEKGVEASKSALTKAGNAVTKFGDESVLKIEKLQFENQLKKQTLELGQKVLDAFASSKTINAEEEPFAGLLKKIEETKAQIKTREDELKL